MELGQRTHKVIQAVVCAALVLETTGHRPFSAPTGQTKLAAFSILASDQPAGLGARVGRGTKYHANPLWGQTEPWEQRIDNGYANVIIDQNKYRLWYDAFTQCNDASRDDQGRYLHCGGGRREHSGLYAESDDGYTWVKPDLGEVEWDTSGKNLGLCCDTAGCKCKLGAAGNIPTNVYSAMADGNGIYLDPHEANASLRYKAIGMYLPSNVNGTPSTDWGTEEHLGGESPGGICASPDGLHFHESDCQWLKFNNMHWDTWSNIFWDSQTERYVGTMRATNPNPCSDTFYPRCMPSYRTSDKKIPGCTAALCMSNGRTMSRYESVGDDWRSLGKVSGNIPTEYGTNVNSQLYVAATFPYYNAYLQVLMVYNAATARQEVHCELSWSNDTLTWHRIEPGTDFIPLGDDVSFESHICYGSIPVEDPRTGVIKEYYFGGDGPHFGVRNSSFALIEFRPAGLVGVGAPTGWVYEVQGSTIPLRVTGSTLVVTADTNTSTGENEQGQDLPMPPGRVTVAVSGQQMPSGTSLFCDDLSGVNVTDHPLSGCDFSALVGKEVALEIEISGGALLYTLGWQ